MNPMKLLELKSHWDKFNVNHPKFAPFLKAAAANGIVEGAVIEIKVVTPEGKSFATNLKVAKSDIELIEAVKELN